MIRPTQAQQRAIEALKMGGNIKKGDGGRWLLKEPGLNGAYSTVNVGTFRRLKEMGAVVQGSCSGGVWVLNKDGGF